MQSGIEGLVGPIPDKAMMRVQIEMLSIGSLPHQPSPAFDDVSTPLFDRALGIVISSHILESV